MRALSCSDLHERLDGGLRGVEMHHCQPLVGAGQREHAINLTGATDEQELAPNRPRALIGIHDYVNPERIDERELSQVEHHPPRSVLDEAEGPHELRGGCDVQLACRPHPRHITAAVSKSAAKLGRELGSGPIGMNHCAGQ